MMLHFLQSKKQYILDHDNLIRLFYLSLLFLQWKNAVKMQCCVFDVVVLCKSSWRHVSWYYVILDLRIQELHNTKRITWYRITYKTCHNALMGTCGILWIQKQVICQKLNVYPSTWIIGFIWPEIALHRWIIDFFLESCHIFSSNGTNVHLLPFKWIYSIWVQAVSQNLDFSFNCRN